MVHVCVVPRYGCVNCVCSVCNQEARTQKTTQHSPCLAGRTCIGNRIGVGYKHIDLAYLVSSSFALSLEDLREITERMMSKTTKTYPVELQKKDITFHMQLLILFACIIVRIHTCTFLGKDVVGDVLDWVLYERATISCNLPLNFLLLS